MIATLGRGRHRRPVGPVICAVALTCLLTGCLAPQPESQDATHHGHGGTDASSGLGQSGSGHDQHAGGAQQPDASTEDAAVQLQALLGHHSIVASEMMRARIRGDEDFAQSANTALGKNTDAMSDMIKALLGESAASQFKTLWTGHVTALFDYSRGLVETDLAVRKEAQSTLGHFEGELAEFFAAGAQGRLPAEAANAAVQAHVHHLLQQAEAYASGDYTRANKLVREAYSDSFGMGKVLAVALLGPDK